MADYPDWVLKHKKKGTYINHVGGKYYLYAAHSERVPGTKKVRRVSDGYIGRITEKDGLIPVRDKVTGVIVYEYGLCMALLALCTGIAKGMQREFRGAAEKVFIAGLLCAAYGNNGEGEYRWSYLSVKYPGLSMGNLTEKQQVGAQRCARMAADALRKQFGEATDEAVARLSRLCAVLANKRIYICESSKNTKEWLSGHNVEWRDWYGEENTGDAFSHQGLRKGTQHQPAGGRGSPKKANS